MHSGSAEQGQTGPLVSVVIPCYNQADYLSEAIESALQQTYPRVEVVVVDDGSTDASAGIAKCFRSVKYIRQENKGVAEACNTGLRISCGEFIMFLGGDDRLTRQAVETHLACFAEHQDAGFVAGDLDLISGDGSYLDSPRAPMGEGEQYDQLLKVDHVANTIAVMFRRDVFDRVGYFNAKQKAGEDYEMILRVARSFRGAQHRNVVTQYRRHSGNMTRDGAMMLRCMLDVMDAQRTYVAGNPGLQRARRKGIRHWRRHYGVVTLRQILKLLGSARLVRATKTALTLARYVRGDLLLLPLAVPQRAFYLLQRKIRTVLSPGGADSARVTVLP